MVDTQQKFYFVKSHKLNVGVFSQGMGGNWRIALSNGKEKELTAVP